MDPAPSVSTRRLLMIAYHFPPLGGSSGVQRTLRFLQHLPRFGWEGMVLSVNARAFEHCDAELICDIPPGTKIERAFALDAARHLSIGGRYLDSMAQPDRWISWKFDGVRRGMNMIRRYRPDAIWSTYPLASAHVIGAALQRRSGLPWVADFRDPMVQANYPKDPKTCASFRLVEEAAFRQASHCVVTTEGARRLYEQRYKHGHAQLEVIENGYDEESFVRAEQDRPSQVPLNPGAVTLLHSGIVYPYERDPTQLVEALGTLKRAGRLRTGEFKIRFRAAVHEDLLNELALRFDVRDLVQVLPPLPYQEALIEMLAADVLLVLQAADCNDQVPAKIYEYLRARRPIIALTDPAGDTAAVLRQAGVEAIAPLDSAPQIAQTLEHVLEQVREGRARLPNEMSCGRAARAERTRDLAAILDAAAATRQIRSSASTAPLL